MTYNTGAKRIEKLNATRETLLIATTLGLYSPHYYSKLIAKINEMMRFAFGSNEREIIFSPKYVYASIAAIPLSFILIIIGSAVVHGAIFLAALGIIVWCIYLWRYIVKMLRSVRTQMVELAIYYQRYDVARSLDESPGYNNTNEKNFYRAFSELADEHNRRLNRNRNYNSRLAY